MLTVAMARTSVWIGLVVAGGEAFGDQVLHIPVHGVAAGHLWRGARL